MCSCKCWCNVIYGLLKFLLFISTIFVWILSDKIYYDSEVSSAIAKEFKENFYSEPITEFHQENYFDKEENKIRNLKETFGLSYVEFGIWKGIVKGCGKTNKDNNQTSIRIYDDKNPCKDEVSLTEIDEVKIRNYSGIILSKSTLLKSYYQLLFDDNSIIFENEECPKDRKSCGYIDTFKNKLCIDLTENSPINYIYINDTPPENVSITKTIHGKNNKKMYISNEPYTNGSKIPTIIGNFKIADSKICTIPNLYYSSYALYPLDANYKQYSNNCLLKNYAQENNFDNPYRYHQLDEIAMYDLYKDNKIIESIENSILVNYGYNISKYFGEDKKLYLCCGIFWGFNKTCLKNRKKEFNIEQLDELDQQYTIANRMKEWASWARGLHTLGEIFTLFTLFEIFDDEPKLKSIIQFGVKYLVAFISYLSNLINTCDAIEYDDTFEENFTCSDNITNALYNIMTKKINDSGKSIENTNYLIIITFVLYIFLFIFYIRFPHQKQSKHSFIKLFYNHTSIKEFIFYIFGLCCSVIAGICIIENLSLINDFVALLSEDMPKDEKYQNLKIYLLKKYIGV